MKDQDRIQHPAYILDSLQLRCISASKDKYNENHVFRLLSSSSDSEDIVVKKSILSNRFARSSLIASLHIPCINFITLQVSSEAFCPSDASSLSGQCGSKFSNDFGFPRNTCAVAMASSINNLKFSYTAHGEHKALNDLTITLLRRRSVFKSSSDYCLLKCIHDVAGSSDFGIAGSVDSMDFQLQRLDCENLAEDSSFVTAVPNSKSLVPFVVYRGDDVDVDDISWLEQKFSNPVGKIMLEFGLNSIVINGFVGTALSSQAIHNQKISPDKDYTQKLEREGCGKEINSSEIESKDQVSGAGEIAAGPSVNCKAKSAYDEAEVNIAEPSILADYDTNESCSLLDGKEEHVIKHVVLQIQESESDTENMITYTKTDKEKSQMVNETDGIEKEESKEFILKSKSQGEITLRKIWFNLAHPTELKILQEGKDYSVNLISSIVPSICSWIPVYVDLRRATDIVVYKYKRHRCSLMAYIMGQALPDKGRLYVKV